MSTNSPIPPPPLHTTEMAPDCRNTRRPPQYVGFSNRSEDRAWGVYCSMFRCNINQVQHRFTSPTNKWDAQTYVFFPHHTFTTHYNAIGIIRQRKRLSVSSQRSELVREYSAETCPFASTLTKPAVPSTKPHLDTQIPLRASGAMFVRFTAPSTTTYAESRGPGQAKPWPSRSRD
jgi:hypothetical protein